ncbi:MAG: DUF2027 domain-containing protein [Bacteroidales bacterium]|jgi:hypothetical protein|nr:DUF2027 domain-containing protein [Bacteroidales bacterium]
MFLKGEKVKFLNEVGGGVVTKVERNIVYVEDEDGFEIPMQDSQLLKTEQQALHPFAVPDFPETATPAAPAAPSLPAEPVLRDHIDLTDGEESPGTTVNVLLAWTADRKKIGEATYHVHLINDCSYHVMYVASILKNNIFYGIQAGTLENDSLIRLADIQETELKKMDAWQLDLLFFKHGSFLPQKPLSYRLAIDEFYLEDDAHYQNNKYTDEKAVIYNVSEQLLAAEIEKAIRKAPGEEKRKRQIDVPHPPQTDQKPEDLEEVDLHIEQLTDHPERLSAGEMLEMQLSRFRIALEGALRNKQKRIIFIHGAGSGRLRLDIRRILEREYPQFRYQDASFKEYGFGATLVSRV